MPAEQYLAQWAAWCELLAIEVERLGAESAKAVHTFWFTVRVLERNKT